MILILVRHLELKTRTCHNLSGICLTSSAPLRKTDIDLFCILEHLKDLTVSYVLLEGSPEYQACGLNGQFYKL